MKRHKGIRFTYLNSIPSGDDLNDLNSLALQISKSVRPVTLESVKNLLRHEGIIAVARNTDGRIIAFGTLIPNARITGLIARIEHIVTGEKYRRQGIGSEILGTLIGEGRRIGAERLDLGTGSKEAGKLYEKFGFDHHLSEQTYWLWLIDRLHAATEH